MTVVFGVMMPYSFVDGSQLTACSMYFVPFILCIILSIYITVFQAASLHAVFQPAFCNKFMHNFNLS